MEGQSEKRPLSEREMLEQEYSALHGTPPVMLKERYDRVNYYFERRLTGKQGEEKDALEIEREVALTSAFYAAVHSSQARVGLCLSGGGIRSATFNLGVLQALARENFLEKIDYLSTVSGGGYVGGWLTAWIHRDPGGQEAVFEQLAGPHGSRKNHSIGNATRDEVAWDFKDAIRYHPNAENVPPQEKPKEGADERELQDCALKEPAPLKHLREYSNYLTPRLGFFRPDTATLIATYIRNLLLNWIVLGPAIIAALLIPRLYVLFLYSYQFSTNAMTLLLRSLAQLLMAVAICGPLLATPAGRRSPVGNGGDDDPEDDQPLQPPWNTGRVVARVLFPLGLSCLLLSFIHAWFIEPAPHATVGNVLGLRWAAVQNLEWSKLTFMSWLSVFVLAPLFLYLFNKKVRQKRTIDWWCVTALLFSGVVLSVVSKGMHELPWRQNPRDYPLEFACSQVPLGLGLYFLLSLFYVGFTSSRPGGDGDREWWGRLMGWTFLTAIGWLAVFGIALGGPRLISRFNSMLQPSVGFFDHLLSLFVRPATPSYLSVWIIVSVALLFLLITAIVGGHSDSTSVREARAPGKLRIILEAGPVIAAYISIPAILILIAWVMNQIMVHISFDSLNDHFSFDSLDLSAPLATTIPHTIQPQPILQDAALLGLLGLIVWLTDVLMNFNRFSLHAVFRDRIIRAFLGASNPQRREDPFTGFDPLDNIPLHHLRRRRYFIRGDLGDPIVPRRIWLLADMLTHCPDAFFVSVKTGAGNSACKALNDALRAYTPCADQKMEAQLESLIQATLVFLNNAIVSNEVCKDLEDKSRPHWKHGEAGRFEPEIELALRALRYDRCPVLVNRLLLEHRCISNGKAYGHYSTQGLLKDWDQLEQNKIALLQPTGQAKPPRPFPIINMALNLVETRNLAWQQRKAASFTATPLHCGFTKGYRRAVEYGGPLTLGTAMTVSGAAASPNMGYHSSPAVTFLMTLFNARLGWWLGNPAHVEPSWLRELLPPLIARRIRDETYRRADPKRSAWTLISEAIGRTNDSYPYVYLSDGGHFDNTGLYEMVRRRCRVILVCDASHDPKCSFDDLGNAIRKIQNDMRVPIVIRETCYFPERSAIRNNKYCAIGEIQYGAVDSGAPSGVLIYIKPARHQLDSIDVFNHGERNPFFPHEPTFNQWFDESQFESYRKLGDETMSYLLRELGGDYGAGPEGIRSQSKVNISRAIDQVIRAQSDEPLGRLLKNAYMEVFGSLNGEQSRKAGTNEPPVGEGAGPRPQPQPQPPNTSPPTPSSSPLSPNTSVMGIPAAGTDQPLPAKDETSKSNEGASKDQEITPSKPE